MNHRSRKSEGWLDREWRAQLGTTIWECPVCSQERLGLKELLVGRLVGTCFVCGWSDLVYLRSGTAWIDAVANGIILATD